MVARTMSKDVPSEQLPVCGPSRKKTGQASGTAVHEVVLYTIVPYHLLHRQWENAIRIFVSPVSVIGKWHTDTHGFLLTSCRMTSILTKHLKDETNINSGIDEMDATNDNIAMTDAKETRESSNGHCSDDDEEVIGQVEAGIVRLIKKQSARKSKNIGVLRKHQPKYVKMGLFRRSSATPAVFLGDMNDYKLIKF